MLSLCACLFLGAGCLSTKFKPRALSLPALPENLRAQIDYPKASIISVEKPVASPNPKYRIRHFELTVPFVVYGSNKTVELDCYTPPSDKPLPVILIFPVSGGGYSIEQLFARYYYRKGYDTIIVYREAPAERDPKTGEQINQMLRQSVLDNKRVVDWVETRPEYDPNKIGVLGTSMGSFKATFLVATDPRIKAAVLGLTGGNFPYILAHSTEGSWHHKGLTRHRDEWLSEHHINRKEFQQLLEKEIVWEQNAVAPGIDPRKVLMILATCDTVVPARTGRELRRLIRKPDTLFVVSGHYTAYLYLPRIKSKILRFFNERLKETPAE